MSGPFFLTARGREPFALLKDQTASDKPPEEPTKLCGSCLAWEAESVYEKKDCLLKGMRHVGLNDTCLNVETRKSNQLASVYSYHCAASDAVYHSRALGEHPGATL